MSKSWPKEPALDFYNSVPGFSETRTDALAIVGDSISYQGKDIIATSFAASYSTLVKAKSGERADQLEASCPALVTTINRWKVINSSGHVYVILNLGSNDGLQGISDTDFIATIVRFYSKLSAIIDGLFIVTVNSATLNSTLNDNAALYNTLIRAGDGVFWTVIDWDAYVVAYYLAGSPDGALTTDGLHPSAVVGQGKLMDLYLAAIP